MSTTIDYYFDLQNIENVDIVKLFKSIIDNNLNNIPYELQILNEDEIKLLEMRGGAEGDTTIPYIFFQQLMDYLTNTKRETEESQQSIYDRMFNPTSVSKEEEEPSEIIKEEQPIMPVEEQPIMPVEEQPIMPVEEQPIMPVKEQPIMPVEEQPPMPLEQQPYVQPEQQPYVQPEQQPIMPPQQQPIMPPQQQPIMPFEKQQYLPPQPQQLIGGNILMKTILKIRLTFKKEYSLQLTFLKKLRYNK